MTILWKHSAQKRYRGTLSSPAEVQKRTGIYWGYTIRLAKSLEHAIDRYIFFIFEKI